MWIVFSHWAFLLFVAGNWNILLIKRAAVVDVVIQLWIRWMFAKQMNDNWALILFLIAMKFFNICVFIHHLHDKKTGNAWKHTVNVYLILLWLRVYSWWITQRGIITIDRRMVFCFTRSCLFITFSFFFLPLSRQQWQPFWVYNLCLDNITSIKMMTLCSFPSDYFSL
jgi:hypothetical protein